jgi:two-component system OmpR family response regulator/two-component system response regulator QseB
MRLLLVEDDEQLGGATQSGLAEAGFAVDWVRDGVAADAALAAEEFAAVVLDLGLPRRSGLDVLARLRAQGKKTPVLILTARDAIEDRVKGLDTGADDYMVKPFRLEELAARLRALVRRAHGAAAPVLKVGAVSLDPATREVTCGGRAVELSTREFGVLRELMLNAGRVLSREQLQSRVYRWGEEVESNAIEVHVHHLRKKLSAEAIRTVRGVGYMMPAAPAS